MKRLHKRPRPDTRSSEPRKHGGRLARIAYGTLLIGVVLAALNFVWGDRVVFRADGLVVRDRTAIAASALSQVTAVDVVPGASVGKGQILLHIQSTELLERLADLSLRQAELAQDDATLSLRAATARQLLPLARKRESEATQILSGLEAAQKANLVVSARYFDALEASYDAREARIRIEAEARTLTAEIRTLAAARTDAERALENLRTHYADGVVRASTQGTLGGTLPAVGDAFPPGETMLAIYSGTPYVLAYLPPRYMFPVSVGMKVDVVGGRVRDTGTIAAILPLTEALPQEFQTSFRPRERSQLARIRLDHPVRFPLLDKVSIGLPWPFLP